MTTDIATVSSLDDERTIRDGEACVTRFERSLSDAREQIIPIARGLLAARRKYPSNEAFGEWFRGSPYHIFNPNDRAALINIGEYEQQIGPFLKDTTLTAPQLIWSTYGGAAKALAPIVLLPPSKTTAAENLPEIAAEPTPQPEKTSLEPIAEAVPKSPASSEPTERPTKKVRQWMLAGRQNADLVFDHVTNTEVRSFISTTVRQKGGGAVWDILVEAIKGGFYGPPSSGSSTTNLLMILPWLKRTKYAMSFDLTKPASRRTVREDLFPLLLEQPELRDPDKQQGIERAMDQRWRAREEQKRRDAMMSRHAGLVAKHQFKDDEQEVIAFGRPLWPHDLTQRYSYEELRSACWFVEFFLGIKAQAKWSDRECGMQGRHLVKYIEPVASGLMHAIHEILNAYELNPTGENKFPPKPIR